MMSHQFKIPTTPAFHHGKGAGGYQHHGPNSTSSDSAVKQQQQPKQVLPSLASSALPAVNPRILELENKPKPRLAHEAGAGAPCMNCKNCPLGLDLHYWRKICKSCKCRKEDHDEHRFTEDPGKILIGRLFDKPPDYNEEMFTDYLASCSLDDDDCHQICEKVAASLADQETNETDVTGSSSSMRRPANDRGGGMNGVYGSSNGFSGPSHNGSVEEKLYEWVPPGTTAELVRKYMEMLPKEQRPVIGTAGASKRRKALAYQIPLHDSEPAAMHKRLTPEERATMTSFVESMKKKAVGQGQVHPTFRSPSEFSPAFQRTDQLQSMEGNHSEIINEMDCENCNNPMEMGEVALYTVHSGPNVCWHPGCFKCCACKELLADLLYFYKDGQYYCGRHYANSAFPRCSGCDELIFAREYTRAEEKDWHLNHFCCFGCDAELGGHRYMVREENPYCLGCYVEKFAKVCEKCQEKIGPDVKRVDHGGSHWHATPECFGCAQCARFLLHQRFIKKGKMVFCSKECKEKWLERDSIKYVTRLVK